MRLIIIASALFACCCGAKERYQDGGSDPDVNKLTEKLWLEIQKRLQDYDGKSDGLDSNEGADRCLFNVQDGQIIRTQDSLNAGATFINSPTVSSRVECQSECCDSDTCNLAVFKAKDDNACYLFDCGTPNVCEFTDHPGFELLTLPTRKSENKEQAKHEDALENLAATPEPTTALPPTTTTPQPAEIHQPAPLFGECKSAKDCAGTWTNCIGGYCLCQDSYHAQDGVCRKDCSRFQYECANEGQPLIYPQCIAIYDKCDGIVHCKDGSDELNCDASAPKDTITGGNISPSVQNQAPPQVVQPVVPQQPQQVGLQPAPQQVPQPVQPQVPVAQQPLSQSYWQQLYEQQFLPQQMQPQPQQPQFQPPLPLQKNPPVQQPVYNSPSQYLGQQQVQGQAPVPNVPAQQQYPQPQAAAPNPGSQPVQQPRLPPQRPPANARPAQQNVAPERLGQRPGPEQPGRQGNVGSHSVGRKPGPRKQFRPAFDAQPPQHSKPSPNDPGQNSAQTKFAGPGTGNSANGGQIHHSDAMINHKPPAQDNGDDDSNKKQYDESRNPPTRKPVPSPNRQQGDSDNRLRPGPDAQSKPVYDDSDSRQPQGTGSQNFPNADAQNYYNYFKGNFDNSGNGNYYGANPGRQGGYFSDGGNVEGSKNNYGNVEGSKNNYGSVYSNSDNSFGNRDKGSLGGYGNRLWQQATGDRGGGYNTDYDTYNYDSSDGGYNVGNNDGVGYYKNGDYTDYYSSPVDSGQGNDQQNEQVDSAPAASNKSPLHSQKPVNRRPPPPPRPPAAAEKPLSPTNNDDSAGRSSSNKNMYPNVPDKNNKLTPPPDAGEDLDQSSNSEDKSDTPANSNVAGGKIPEDSSSDGKSEGEDSNDLSDTPSVENAETENEGVNPKPVIEVAQQTGDLEDMVEEESDEDDVVLPSNKGAIVALALGLAITAILLVFVGCRLRNVKRRLRRGRPLNSNEADYLVNGMYL